MGLFAPEIAVFVVLTAVPFLLAVGYGLWSLLTEDGPAPTRHVVIRDLTTEIVPRQDAQSDAWTAPR